MRDSIEVDKVWIKEKRRLSSTTKSRVKFADKFFLGLFGNRFRIFMEVTTSSFFLSPLWFSFSFFFPSLAETLELSTYFASLSSSPFLRRLVTWISTHFAEGVNVLDKTERRTNCLNGETQKCREITVELLISVLSNVFWLFAIEKSDRCRLTFIFFTLLAYFIRISSQPSSKKGRSSFSSVKVIDIEL